MSFPSEEEDAAIEAEESPEQKRRLEEPEREKTADASEAEGGEAQIEESSSSSTSVDSTEEPEGERISEAHMDASIRSSLNNEAARSIWVSEKKIGSNEVQGIPLLCEHGD